MESSTRGNGSIVFVPVLVGAVIVALAGNRYRSEFSKKELTGRMAVPEESRRGRRPEPFSGAPRRGGAMLERMETGAGNVVGFRFDGDMTAEDYNAVLIPALEEAGQSHPIFRILFHIVNFRGWKPYGHWEALKGWPGMERVDRIAIVGGEKWQEWMNHLPGLFVGFIGIDVRYFSNGHLDAAIDWLREPIAAEEATPGAG